MTDIRGSWSEVAIPVMATVAVLLVALVIRRNASLSPMRKLPPGPRGWPILGSLPLLGTQPHQSFFKLSKQYGPLMFMRLGSVKTLVVTSPKFAEEVLKTHDKIMCSRMVYNATKKIFYNGVDVAWAPYGQHWRYVRKGCTAGLLTVTRISQFRVIREREVMDALHFILAESERGNAVNMTKCLSIISINNISQMIMSRNFWVQSSGSNPAPPTTSTSLPMYLKEIFEVIGAFNIADYIPLLKPFDLQGIDKRTKAVHQRVDQSIEEIIDEHRQRRSIADPANCREDFVDALLGFGQTKEFQERLSLDSVKAIMLEMVGAGGDTSSATAVWALAELLKQPRLLRKVQEELDSVVGPHRLLQEEDLPDLHYFNAVVKETFRLHPPGPFLIPHESTQDCEIEGFHIPARTNVFVNVWGMQRDPAVWERPLEFDPDRFLNSTVDFKGQDFDLLPFGSGRRICPGINLGTLMVMYPLSLLLHAINWTLPDGEKPEEMDMPENFALVLTKRLPLEVFGKARLPHDVLYPAQPVKQ
ncbi:unnamed protein product [Calypogeia fissa]